MLLQRSKDMEITGSTLSVGLVTDYNTAAGRLMMNVTVA
jgi:hypothetical protein